MAARALKVVQYPAPVLRTRCSAVRSEDIAGPGLQGLLRDMLATVALEDGLGLAAPQVGATDRVFVMRTPLPESGGRRRRRQRATPAVPTWHAVINPEIRRTSRDNTVWVEACLSIPDYAALTRRASAISVEYTAGDGRRVAAQLSGLPAAVFQHELDHLNGTLLMDREQTPPADGEVAEALLAAAEARMARALAVQYGERGGYGEREGS